MLPDPKTIAQQMASAGLTSAPSVLDKDGAEAFLAREFALNIPLRVHRGYVYADEVPEIPHNKRVKITIEYEVEGVDYHNATQE